LREERKVKGAGVLEGLEAGRLGSREVKRKGIAKSQIRRRPKNRLV
jgi:hypothetical protein